ncbi:MAG: amino acid-binding protein, partial [Verrucomicrobia bacterium]
MKLKVTRAVVWAASIEDRPGALADKLGALAKGGAKLDFVLARRAPESPGMGVVFVAPLKGERQMRAAIDAGFVKT